MYTVVTSFNEKYWNDMTSASIQELDKNWHKTSNVLLYHQLTDGTLSNSRKNFSKRVNWIDLYKNCPELVTFIDKWKDHPKANGAKGYKWNAVKFCHKTFAIWHAWKTSTSDWLLWMDADSVFFKPFDKTFQQIVFKPNIICSYVGRPNRHSECGFMAFNLKNKKTHEFMKQWEDLFLSGEFINLQQTHDSWTFDVMRKKFDQSLFNDLNVKKSGKHPIHASLVGPYINHAKGSDKLSKLQKFKKRKLN